jgi:hypothetical protein
MARHFALLAGAGAARGDVNSIIGIAGGRRERRGAAL